MTDRTGRDVIEEAWALLHIAYQAHQKLGLEGKGDLGLSHEVRMFAAEFSQAEQPKTPQHMILSGTGRYWKWRNDVKELLLQGSL